MVSRFLTMGLALALAPSAAWAGDYRYGGYGARDVCAEVRQDRGAAGAAIGGIVGGLLGNELAASGVRGEGTALGAVVGALAGAAIGGDTVDCPRPSYGGFRYQQADYGYGHADLTYGGTRYAEPTYGRPAYDSSYTFREPDLYGGPDTARRVEGDPAARECETVYEVTRLPDGMEIRRPVQACREAYYGDWRLAE